MLNQWSRHNEPMVVDAIRRNEKNRHIERVYTTVNLQIMGIEGPTWQDAKSEPLAIQAELRSSSARGFSRKN